MLRIGVVGIAVICGASATLAGGLEDCGQSKQRDRRIAACSQLIRANARNADAYFNRGLAYWVRDQGQYSPNDDSTAVMVDPFRGILYTTSMLYRGSDLNAKAIADFDRVIALNPKFVAAYIHRGRVHAAESSGKAEPDFTRAIELDAQSAEAFFYRGSVRHGAEAMADLGRAIALNPSLAVAYNNRGVHGIDSSAAIEDYREALRLDVNLSVALNNLGVSLWGKKRLDGSHEDFQRGHRHGAASQRRIF